MTHSAVQRARADLLESNLPASAEVLAGLAVMLERLGFEVLA
jgi:hypothetical protein